MANEFSVSQASMANRIASKRRGISHASDAIDREVELTLVPALPTHLKLRHVGIGHYIIGSQHFTARLREGRLLLKAPFTGHAEYSPRGFVRQLLNAAQ